MKNPKTVLIVVGVLLLLAVGFFFVRGPKPVIEIKAETLADLGPLPLVNTYVSSSLAVIVTIVIFWIGTRKMTMVPGRAQNFVEFVAETGLNMCTSTAGERNGRRFFAVFMTIFVFIWIANWLALFPFYNSIGAFEKVTAEDFHKEAVVMSKSAGISLIHLNQKSIKFEADTVSCNAYETSSASGTSATQTKDECVNGLRGKAIAEQLDKKEDTHSGVEACATMSGSQQDECYVTASDTAIQQLNDSGKRLGLLKPYFRSTNTDINSPLSIAIMSAIFVEGWGITTLGFFRYGSKFFTLRSPIAFFVGILEFVAEIARLISFTFRLFGNLMAGEIVLLVMTFLVPFVITLPFYALEMFVGVIQAFIFAMLTLVFGVLAVSAHDDHDDHGEHAEHAVEGAAHA